MALFMVVLAATAAVSAFAGDGFEPVPIETVSDYVDTGKLAGPEVTGVLQGGASYTNQDDRIKFNSGDSSLEVIFPIPATDDHLRANLAIDAGAMFLARQRVLRRDDGAFTKDFDTADQVARWFSEANMEVRLTNVNGDPVLIGTIGKDNARMGLRVCELDWNCYSNPLNRSGVNGHDGIVGFALTVPPPVFRKIIEKVFGSEDRYYQTILTVGIGNREDPDFSHPERMMNTFYGELAQYFNERFAVMLGLNYSDFKSKEGEYSGLPSEWTGNVGFVYENPDDSLTIWMQGYGFKNNHLYPGALFAINAGVSTNLDGILDNRLRASLEVTAIDGQSTSVAVGLRYLLSLFDKDRRDAFVGVSVRQHIAAFGGDDDLEGATDVMFNLGYFLNPKGKVRFNPLYRSW